MIADLELPNFPRERLELATLRLYEAPGEGPPSLIVAPYALHDAAIADLAPGHSLARALLDAGLAPLSLVSWKSATPEMRDFGVDAYLADLDRVVDGLGGRATLIGLCQGGWMAALYAARFPQKVAALAAAGAPLDPHAAASDITRALALTPPGWIEAGVAMMGGRVFGRVGLTGAAGEYEPARALQCDPDPALRATFEAWRERRLALPGRFFLETAEWLFRENRLAQNRFPALGRLCGLAHVAAPLCTLAALDDRIVPPPQACAPGARVALAEGGHLSLFMGRRTLATHWPDVARWLRKATRAR